MFLDLIYWPYNFLGSLIVVFSDWLGTAKENAKAVEIIVGAATPIMVAILGLWIQRTIQNLDKRHRANDRLVAKRVDIYEKVGPPLNSIYAYIERKGHWKELSPDDIIRKKRFIDRQINIYRVLWSKETFRKYNEYMDAAFSTHQGPGKNARINAEVAPRIRSYTKGTWQLNWNDCFTGIVDPLHEQKHKELIEEFFKNFN